MRVLRALCLIAALIAGAAQAGVAQAATLSGLVLVASEDMPDPRFQETVIYLVNHNENGAFGLIVNKPQGRGPLAALLDELGIELDGAYEDERPTGSITCTMAGPCRRRRASSSTPPITPWTAPSCSPADSR